jgi:O-antigen ligase
MSPLLARGAALSFLLLAAALPWSIAPMSIAVVLCGILTLLFWWRPGGERWIRSPIDLPAIGWLAALAIAAFAGEDPLHGAPRIAKGLLLAIVPVAAFHARDARQARRACLILLGSAILATIYALVKFAAHGGAFPVRVRGAAGHPLTYGGQAMILAILAFALLVRIRERRWIWIAGLLLLLLGPALLGSYTRSAWIGTLIGMAAVLAMTRARWLPVLLAVVACAFLLLPAGYRARAASVFDARSPWSVERIHLWEAGWKMFRERPITGVGLQDLRPWVERYRSPQAHEPPQGHMHDVYLQVAVTMGLVGLAAFAWLLAGLFRTAAGGLGEDLRAREWSGSQLVPGRVETDRFGLALRVGAVAALIGFFTAGLFEWNFGDEELIDLLFVLIGMAFAARRWGGLTPGYDSTPMHAPEVAEPSAGSRG